MATKTKKPYYQFIVDELATSVFNRDEKKALLALCVATEAKGRAAIRKARISLLRNFDSTEVGFHIIPEEILYETMFRLLEMGDTDSLLALIEWYRGFYGSLLGNDKKDLNGKYVKSFAGNNWQGMVQCIKRPEPSMTDGQLRQYWKMIVRGLECAIPAFINSKKPKSSRFSRLDVPLRTALTEVLIVLVSALINTFQLMLERGLAELEKSGHAKKSKLRALHERWTADQAHLFENLKDPDQLVRKVEIPKARVLERRERFYYLDAFPPHDARRFRFNFYSRDDTAEDPESETILLRELFRTIDKRLMFHILQLGVVYDPLFLTKMKKRRRPSKLDAQKETRAKPAPLTKRQQRLREKSRKEHVRSVAVAQRTRQALINKHIRKPAFSTDEELARFACALYTDHLVNPPKGETPTKQDAWGVAMNFLGGYLDTETSHTVFNLVERPAYIGRLFPRAINGGQIHDCGVYACRMANVFLHFAACTRNQPKGRLDLEVSFLILPLHVGLMVQGNGITPTFVHNQTLFSLPPNEEKSFFDEWKNDQQKYPSDPDPADPDKSKQKFWEDVAALVFLQDVDLPLHRADLKGVSIPPGKGQIDRAYDRQVRRTYSGLFSRRIERDLADEFSFDLQFLEALLTTNRWYNVYARGLWNKFARDAYQGYLESSRRGGKSAVDKARATYLTELKKRVAFVEKKYDEDVREPKEILSASIRSKKKRVLGPKAQRITLSKRLKKSALILGPVGAIRQHIKVVEKSGIVPEPLFALDTYFLPPISQ